MNTLGKLPFSLAIAISLGSVALTACNDKPENPPVSATPTNAEKEVPMSAKPADTKEKPITVGEEGKVEAVVASSTAPTDTALPASPTPEATMPVGVDSSIEATAEGGADNSGMDKISENDQVIDDAPASPDAPKAQEEKSEISNPPTGHKQK